MNASNLLLLLEEKGLTIGSVESFTGGLFASTLTANNGASKSFVGTIVTYATRIKTDIVKVDSQVIAKYGVISKECAFEMALKGRELLNVDLAISFTGNAGPATMENKPAGLGFIGLSDKYGTEVVTINGFMSRNEFRQQAVSAAINFIFQRLQDKY
ncbi:MAG TPA: CinA family protein [Bacilli bacterium]|nr:CinA family protein [Bacilli bacterium]